MYVFFFGIVLASFSVLRSPKLKLSSMSLYLPYAKKRYMYPPTPEDNLIYMRKNGRCLFYYLLRDKDYLGT